MLAANPDLPSNVGPGQYLYLNSRGQNPGSQDRARSGRFRLNVVAPVTSDGLLFLTPDTPRLRTKRRRREIRGTRALERTRAAP